MHVPGLGYESLQGPRAFFFFFFSGSVGLLMELLSSPGFKEICVELVNFSRQLESIREANSWEYISDGVSRGG